MTNKAAFFARSIPYVLSTVMVIMSSMNPSIDDSLASMFLIGGLVFQDDPRIGVYPPLGVGSYVVS